jgi:predicted amidophosphoribosyltransferase
LARRYNQSALLANALGRAAGVPVDPALLVRRRRTPSQGGLTRDQRRRNVAGAFAVAAGRRDGLAAKRVLLVDDVMTTGATVEGCTRTLRRAGAAAVDVLTLARVVRPEPTE